MATKKQIEANRCNAGKSTGPRSVEGKSRSSMNALKSGIDAKSQIIDGERQVDLVSLTEEYYQRFAPAAPEQRMLVDTLIDADWLLRRFRRCEAQLWEDGLDCLITENKLTEIGRAYAREAGIFGRLQRRIDAAHRNYRNSLHELERLQAAQAERPAVPEPEALPATPPNQTVKPQNGFVPHIQPEAPLDPAPTPPELRADSRSPQPKADS